MSSVKALFEPRLIFFSAGGGGKYCLGPFYSETDVVQAALKELVAEGYDITPVVEAKTEADLLVHFEGIVDFGLY